MKRNRFAWMSGLLAVGKDMNMSRGLPRQETGPVFDKRTESRQPISGRWTGF